MNTTSKVWRHIYNVFDMLLHAKFTCTKFLKKLFTYSLFIYTLFTYSYQYEPHGKAFGINSL